MSTATVTLLFCDLVRSTELLGRLGGTDADRVRQACFQAIRGAVSETGGREVKSLGDGVMVVFTSAVDSVRCAVAMQHAMARLNRREPGLDLALRIGLSVGEATAEDDDWFGAPVIEAARLCQRAQAGQILASALVEALAGRRADITSVPVGSLRLKGLDDPVPAVEVLWDTSPPAAGVPPPLATAATGVFVGRRHELDELTAAWRAAARGEGRAAFVAGDPGIGKTRLAAELAHRAAADGGVVLYGRCDEDLSVPYQPFADALRAATETAHWDSVRHALGDDAVRLSHVVRGVDGMGESPAHVLDPDGERYRTFEAVHALLRTLCGRAPVLLVLDDLHWAARPAALLLRHVVRAASELALLVVGTYRDVEVDRRHPLADALADLRRDGGDGRVRLGGLDAADVRSYLEASVGAAIEGRAGDVATLLHRETEGNPFFVTQMVRHFVETGGTTAEVAATGLPDSVREVVARRVARLSADATAVLEIASACGPEVLVPVLEEIGGAERSVVQALDEAVRARLLVEVGPGTLTFTHGLVRQSLYWGMTGVRRVHLHRLIGEALERRGATAAAVLPHFTEAAPQGGAAKAAQYALAAGRDAMARVANEEAVLHLRTGLSALDRYGPSDTALHGDLLATLAEALYRVWEWKEAADVAAQAANEARTAKDGRTLARAALVTAMATPVGAVDDPSPSLCAEALALLSETEAALRSRVLAAGVSYSVGHAEGTEQLRARSEEALALARRSGDALALSESLFARAHAHRVVGAHRDVVAACDELLAVASDAGDPYLNALGLSDRTRTWVALADRRRFDQDRAALSELAAPLGGQYERWARMYDTVAALLDGRFDEVQDSADRSLAVLEHPQVNDVNIHVGQTVLLHRETGRIADLLPFMEEVVAREPGIAAFRAALAMALAETDQLQRAAEHFEVVARDDFETLPLDVTWIGTLALVAETCALLGSRAHAPRIRALLEPHAGSILVMASTVGAVGAADRYLGMLAATTEDWDEAVRRYEAAVEVEERLAAPPLLTRTKLWFASTLEKCGQHDRAAKMKDEAGALAASLGMTGVVVT